MDKMTATPVFENEIIHELYRHDFRLPKEILQQILSLPEDSLLRDLEKAMADAEQRYSHFLRTDSPVEETSFLPHAVYILAERGYTECLPDVLKILRKEEKFLDFYFGDEITELLWTAIYKLTGNNISILFDFMKEYGLSTFAKVPVNETLQQLFFQRPELQAAIIDGYRDLAYYFIEHREDKELVKDYTMDEAVCIMHSIAGDALDEPIRALYDNDLILEGYAGSYEELSASQTNVGHIVQPVTDMYTMYQKVVDTWASYNEEEKMLKGDDFLLTKPFVRSEPKTGRNDLCPCGSGKKYKKCCMKE